MRTVSKFKTQNVKTPFYRIKAHTQGKTNGGEFESCIPGMRYALSAEKGRERKRSLWRLHNLLWPPYKNQSRKHKALTCFYKLSLDLVITFVLHIFLCCYLWSILTLIIGICVLHCIANPRFQLKKKIHIHAASGCLNIQVQCVSDLNDWAGRLTIWPSEISSRILFLQGSHFPFTIGIISS